MRLGILINVNAAWFPEVGESANVTNTDPVEEVAEGTYIMPVGTPALGPK